METVASTTEEGVFFAKVAEQAERYEDMLVFLKPILLKPEELRPEERNLLQTAYKFLSGNKRSAWRTMSAIEENPKYDKHREKAHMYKLKVEQDLKRICEEVHSLIDNSLYKHAFTPESKVFCLKMKADYYRYIAEVSSVPERQDPAQKALENYEYAKQFADTLPTTDSARLGLALNSAVFQYEILKNVKEACAIAKAAFDQAMPGLTDLDDEKFKESAPIVQMLKDNLTLWTSELSQAEAEAEAEAAVEFPVESPPAPNSQADVLPSHSP